MQNRIDTSRLESPVLNRAVPRHITRNPLIDTETIGFIVYLLSHEESYQEGLYNDQIMRERGFTCPKMIKRILKKCENLGLLEVIYKKKEDGSIDKRERKIRFNNIYNPSIVKNPTTPMGEITHTPMGEITHTPMGEITHTPMGEITQYSSKILEIKKSNKKVDIASPKNQTKKLVQLESNNYPTLSTESKNNSRLERVNKRLEKTKKDLINQGYCKEKTEVFIDSLKNEFLRQEDSIDRKNKIHCLDPDWLEKQKNNPKVFDALKERLEEFKSIEKPELHRCQSCLKMIHNSLKKCNKCENESMKALLEREAQEIENERQLQQESLIEANRLIRTPEGKKEYEIWCSGQSLSRGKELSEGLKNFLKTGWIYERNIKKDLVM